jgi:hypothetical protein
VFADQALRFHCRHRWAHCRSLRALAAPTAHQVQLIQILDAAGHGGHGQPAAQR